MTTASGHRTVVLAMLGAALSLSGCERDSAVRERKAPAVVRLHRRVLRDRDTIPLTGRGSPPGEPFDIETSPSGHLRATWRCHLLAEPRVQQHDPRPLSNGNLLIFDNGTHHRDHPTTFSRVIEVDLNRTRFDWTPSGLR